MNKYNYGKKKQVILAIDRKNKTYRLRYLSELIGFSKNLIDSYQRKRISFSFFKEIFSAILIILKEYLGG